MQYILVIFLSLLMSIGNAASAISNHFPSDLIFSGKPIDSLCFFNLESQSDLIQLNHCGLAKEKYVIKGENTYLTQKGFIGFDWRDPNASYSQGYSYYQIFDAGNRQYWIYTINNGGGSGDFTAVNLVKRKDAETLEIKNVMAGDRCNGGIQDITEQHHQLTFSVNITAADFLSLANDNPHHLKAYDDLSACAACCAAKAFYEVDSTLNPKLKYVHLNDLKNVSEMSEQGTYHACFNKLFASYVSNGEAKLDNTKLKKFVREFNETCIK